MQFTQMRKLFTLLFLSLLIVTLCKKDKMITYTIRIDKDADTKAFMDAEDCKPRRDITGSTYNEDLIYQEDEYVQIHVAYVNIVDKSLTVRVYKGNDLIKEDTENKQVDIKFYAK